MSSSSIIVIAGPTASGKSGLAVDIAKEINGVVVNFDSMQIYKHMPILSAVPSEEEKEGISHRLYEVFEPSKNGSVKDWLNLAVPEIKNIWDGGKTPVLVGGTGLYIDNLINGTTPIPETNVEVRQRVRTLCSEIGSVGIHDLLKSCDKEAAERLSSNDTTRVCRAYEVWLDTGKKLSDWHKVPMIKKLPEAQFKVTKILPSQMELDERCFLRFEKMMKQGALEEAELLYSQNLDRKLPAMRALGLPELLDFFDGKTSLNEAVELAKLHTRQYAKRQRTWFANKLNANITLSECYKGQKNLINDVKKAL